MSINSLVQGNTAEVLANNIFWIGSHKYLDDCIVAYGLVIFN